jgi:membrane associated rhomboid family serine protease
MFLFPFNVDVPMQRVPLANWALIAVTVLLSLAFRADPSAELSDTLVLQRGNFSMVQLIGHLFAHGGILHLFGNMAFLFCFGNAINAKLGHLPFLGLYFAAGIAGGLAWLAVGGGDALIGASGAVMGMAGAFLMFYPRNDVSVLYWFIVMAGTFQITSYFLILIYIALDIWGMVAGGGPVAYSAHVAGAMVGLAVSGTLAMVRLAPPGRGEENLFQLIGLHPRTDTRGPGDDLYY